MLNIQTHNVLVDSMVQQFPSLHYIEGHLIGFLESSMHKMTLVAISKLQKDAGLNIRRLPGTWQIGSPTGFTHH